MNTTQPIVKPSWFQQEILTHPARYKVSVNGRRTGKTVSAKLLLYTNAIKGANKRFHYINRTYGQAKSNMWNELVDPNIGIFPQWMIKHANVGNLTITLKNNTEIVLAGGDNIDSILGVSSHGIILDEYQSQKPDNWYRVQPMLSTTGGWAYICGTPRGYNHLYDLWWMGWKDNPGQTKDWHSWQITTEEGGIVSEDEVMGAASTMSQQQFDQEYCASFQNLQGRVYPSYDPNIWPVGNIHNDLTLDPDPALPAYSKVPLLVGMDFNVNPMTATICVKNNKQLHVVDEIVLPNSDTNTMITEINNKYPDRRIIVYPDPAGNQRRTSAAGKTDHILLREAGYEVRVKSAHPAIKDRINQFSAMLCNARGERNLIIHPRCQHLIKAMVGLTYDLNGQVDKKSQLDHITDGLGYLIDYDYSLEERTKQYRYG